MSTKRSNIKKVYRCSRCRAMKPPEEFALNKSKLRGLQDYCKTCIKITRNPQTERNRTLGRFKLSVEDDKRLRESQDNKCAICQIDLNLRRLAIDHDHSCCPGYYTCGKCIRGLLCSSCNTGLGMFYDNPLILFAAARYLLKTNEFLLGRSELSYESLELEFDPFI